MTDFKIYVARHGETDWNAEPARCQGWTDIPLNEKGIRQAALLADKAKVKNIAKIYSSHLKRALQTANIIADELGVELKIDERLAEARKGLWEGMSFAEIKLSFPDIWGKWLDEPLTAPIPEGETISDVIYRVSGCLSDIVASEDRNVLVISHGGPISALRCISAGISVERFHEMHPNNGELFDLNIEPFIIHNVKL